MTRIVVSLVLCLLLSLTYANDFRQINTSEWRMAKQLVERTNATRTSCPSNVGNAACFRWPMFLLTARGAIDDYLLHDSPGRQFVKTDGEWQNVSETEIMRYYTHYGDPMIAYFNGRVLILMKE